MGALVVLMVLMMGTYLWGLFLVSLMSIMCIVCPMLSWLKVWVEVDTAGWAEGWEKLSGRIEEGFEAIAKEMEEKGGGNALVVSHGMTIGTIVYLINGMHPHGLDNGSVTILEYEDGQFSVEVVGDRSYRELGREKMEEASI